MVPISDFDGEIFCSLNEAKIVIENWRRHYNAVRPHGSLGYKSPAPEVFVSAPARAGGSPAPNSYAARASIEAVNALTFEVDPSVGARQNSRPTSPVPERGR